MELGGAFAAIDRVTILARGPSATDERGLALPTNAVLVTGPTYAKRDVFAGDPIGVLIGTPPDLVEQIAQRFHATPTSRRPVLMYTFLPHLPEFDFAALDLHPIPIAPALRQAHLYEFDGEPYPTSGVFLMLLAAALGKRADVAGIDLYQHPSGRTYSIDRHKERFEWPKHHSLECDLRYLRRAVEHRPRNFNLSPALKSALEHAHHEEGA
jgi:hypothetical protein